MTLCSISSKLDVEMWGVKGPQQDAKQSLGDSWSHGMLLGGDRRIEANAEAAAGASVGSVEYQGVSSLTQIT